MSFTVENICLFIELRDHPNQLWTLNERRFLPLQKLRGRESCFSKGKFRALVYSILIILPFLLWGIYTKYQNLYIHRFGIRQSQRNNKSFKTGNADNKKIGDPLIGLRRNNLFELGLPNQDRFLNVNKYW